MVGAGRGAGGADGFDGVVELAELLDGALGVSRVVTSLGWRPHHEQIGQTGSRIAPELYIPCGISGAIQHWAGCSSSKTIVAINTDENAPMVTKATYAVIGDMAEVVPRSTPRSGSGGHEARRRTPSRGGAMSAAVRGLLTPFSVEITPRETTKLPPLSEPAGSRHGRLPDVPAERAVGTDR